jgi:hypothetical protein
MHLRAKIAFYTVHEQYKVPNKPCASSQLKMADISPVVQCLDDSVKTETETALRSPEKQMLNLGNS